MYVHYMPYLGTLFLKRQKKIKKERNREGDILSYENNRCLRIINPAVLVILQLS